MGQNEPIRKSPFSGGSEIPDKLYFRIGEVARLCEVPAYVLRFWESEFPQLKPNKGGTGQRLYRRRDVEMALRVKRLLYDEGYTIPGARQVFKSEVKQKDVAPQLALPGANLPDPKQLLGLKRELQAIVAILSRPAGTVAAGKNVHTLKPAKRVGTPRVMPASGASRRDRNEILFETLPLHVGLDGEEV